MKTTHCLSTVHSSLQRETPKVLSTSSSNTNKDGWTGCNLRSTLQNTIYKQLPSELRSIIKTVSKKTTAGSQLSTVNTTSDTLFLFSEVEIFGSATMSLPGEGSQYPIFTDANSRIKKLGDNGTAQMWWERSPYKTNNTILCAVASNGARETNSAGVSQGICFGFCI